MNFGRWDIVSSNLPAVGNEKPPAFLPTAGHICAFPWRCLGKVNDDRGKYHFPHCRLLINHMKFQPHPEFLPSRHLLPSVYTSQMQTCFLKSLQLQSNSSCECWHLAGRCLWSKMSLLGKWVARWRWSGIVMDSTTLGPSVFIIQQKCLF